MESNHKCHSNKVVFFPVAEEKRALKLVALPFVREGIIHVVYSVTFICQGVPKVWRWPGKNTCGHLTRSLCSGPALAALITLMQKLVAPLDYLTKMSSPEESFFLVN